MKYNKYIKSLLFGSLLLMAGSVSITSCTDWLDKDPESIVSGDEAFKNYRNFQGYIEEIYSLIPDKEKVNYCTSWNFGDDAVHNPEGYAHMDHQVDLGNYRDVWSNDQCWLRGRTEKNPDGTDKIISSLWTGGWYSIRKCNLGIANIKSLIGSDEERDLLLGQLYFFRAWWHFEMMCYWGGLPYVDKAYETDSIPPLPRLSFQECANRCAEDFEKAADLLPVDWDRTLTGKQSGENELRINKIMALCYLGKCYLWAGSPLMKEFEKTKDGSRAQLLGASSNGKTYDYDVEYCRKAAETFGKVLNMVRKGQTQYKLAEFKYSNIYDHEKEDPKAECYSDIFYVLSTKENWLMPGSTEAIFRGLSPDGDKSNWNCSKLFGPKVAGIVSHDNIIHHPTANLIDQYGMANGQPIYIVKNGVYVLNPESGWDPSHPYKNRDPRFYHDIVFDGFRYVLQRGNLQNDEQKEHDYCSLYTGGAMRAVAKGSSTGYFIQKLVPHQCNEGDKWYYAWIANSPGKFHCYLPYMRLADIYLMYAEAQGVVGGPNSTSTTCNLTAVDAINVLRDRVNSLDYPMEHVQPNFLDTKEHFLDEVRRERAVELAFEGFRWCDLQRWLLLTEPPYTVKYSHEFERMEPDSWYFDATSRVPNHDPKDAQVANFRKKELITRHFDSKHYWFPLPDKDTYLYEGFTQNPGW